MNDRLQKLLDDGLIEKVDETTFRLQGRIGFGVPASLTECSSKAAAGLEALERLATEDEPKAELVKLRFFIGLTNAEAAQVAEKIDGNLVIVVGSRSEPGQIRSILVFASMIKATETDDQIAALEIVTEDSSRTVPNDDA